MNAKQLFQKLTSAKMISIRTPRTEEQPEIALDWPADTAIEVGDVVGFDDDFGWYRGGEVVGSLNDQIKVSYDVNGATRNSLWLPTSMFTLIFKSN